MLFSRIWVLQVFDGVSQMVMNGEYYFDLQDIIFCSWTSTLYSNTANAAIDWIPFQSKELNAKQSSFRVVGIGKSFEAGPEIST